MTESAGGAYSLWQRTGDRVVLWACSILLTVAINLVSLLRGSSRNPRADD